MKLTGFNYLTLARVEVVLAHHTCTGTVGTFFDTTNEHWEEMLAGKDGLDCDQFGNDDDSRIDYFEEYEEAKAMLLIACSMMAKDIHCCVYCKYVSSVRACSCGKGRSVENITY